MSSNLDALSQNQRNQIRLAYFENANDAVVVFDYATGFVLDVNNYACKLLGYSHEELLGKNVFDIHADDEREIIAKLLEELKTDGFVCNITSTHLKDRNGQLIDVEKNGTLFTIDGRMLVQCTFRDISERARILSELNHRIKDLHILSSIALEITSGLDYAELLHRIATNAVMLLNSDAGAIGIFDERKGSLAYEYLFNLPQSLSTLEIPLGAGLTSYVLDTRKAIRIDDYQQYPKAIKEFKDAGLRAIAMVPLIVNNRILGTLLAMNIQQNRVFDDSDMSLLEAVAPQAAIAIYNSQLFEQMRVEGQFRKALNELTSLIGASLDLHKVYELICEESTNLFKTTGTYLYTVNPGKQELYGEAAYGEHADEFKALSRSLAEPSLPSYVYHTRKALLVHDVDSHMLAKTDTERRFLLKTVMAIPILVDGAVTSILVFASNEKPYYFDDTKLEQAKILSNQVAFAVKNADLYEQTNKALSHERYVAITLQQSLLPIDTPSLAHSDLGTYYAPSQKAHVAIGGDFYDLVQLNNGCLAITIGDVSGKGIEAAAVTAMVKYAMRSFIYRNPCPDNVVTQANNIISMQLKSGYFVSLCYGLFDPDSGIFDFTNAGHPYPIICDAAQRKCKTVETDDPIIGLIRDYNYSRVSAKLNPNDVLFLYTDGLIEARYPGFEPYGLERITESIENNFDIDSHSLASKLAEDARVYAKGELSDDIAIVVLRRR